MDRVKVTNKKPLKREKLKKKSDPVYSLKYLAELMGLDRNTVDGWRRTTRFHQPLRPFLKPGDDPFFVNQPIDNIPFLHSDVVNFLAEYYPGIDEFFLTRCEQQRAKLRGHI